ncbi:MAG TPA: DUF502 domain-containing protein [Firmicutes bacterium]|jgi:uncharacterized membrane protein|nr:DUF502 domain-containing protein [Bacillota bacterium]HOQ23906.1 DUF502 domain-containing protein [Bacillota bacterium]HPT67158.1 DUF502 domain-containing protein [Bacillota bacterium]
MFTRKLRNYFLTGLFTILPIIVTGYILVWGFTWADGILGRFVIKVFRRPVPGMGLLISLVFVTVLGIFAKNYLGSRLVGFIERIILQIPLAGNIYGTTKQIMEAISSPDKTFFRSVVMVEYPRPGMFSPGFIVGKAPVPEASVDATEEAGEPVTVFIPTTPNPATGFLVFVPESQITPLPMSVEEGLKFFLSVGVVHPNHEKTGSLGQENSLVNRNK